MTDRGNISRSFGGWVFLLPGSEFVVLFCTCSTGFAICSFYSLRAAYLQALEVYR